MMNTITVPFKSIKTRSFEAMVNGVPVISHKIMIHDDVVLSTTARIERRIEKSDRDFAAVSIAHIDYETGIAAIHYDDEKVDSSIIEFLKQENTRLMINSINMQGDVTAIVGFTAVSVV